MGYRSNPREHELTGWGCFVGIVLLIVMPPLGIYYFIAWHTHRQNAKKAERGEPWL